MPPFIQKGQLIYNVNLLAGIYIRETMIVRLSNILDKFKRMSIIKQHRWVLQLVHCGY